MVRNASEPLERRRNNAFTGGAAAMRQIFTIRRNPPVRGVARPPLCHTQFFCGRASPTASAVSREGLPWRCHTKAFPRGRVVRKASRGRRRAKASHRSSQAMAETRRRRCRTSGGRPAGDASAPWLRHGNPSESNKGLSKSLSALGGKSTRVRRESPSKTPKNGF